MVILFLLFNFNIIQLFLKDHIKTLLKVNLQAIIFIKKIVLFINLLKIEIDIYSTIKC